jgi:sugar lactone lactonase YvrE
MRSTPLLVALSLLVAAAVPGLAGGRRERRDRRQPVFTEPGALLEKVATGFEFTEGPAADAEGNVYFSDAPANRILVLPPVGPARVWKSPSRGANGMLFDREGRLITCNSQLAPDGRSVTRYERDGRVTVLADNYQGRRLNSPNDLALDREGRVYFTDPRYGDLKDLEQDRQAVYRIEKDGRLTRVIDDAQTPNGILISGDGKTLYLADNSPAPGGARTLVAYDLDKGRATRRAVLHDFRDGRGIDGMALDERGNIYATAGLAEKTGVYVFSPEGRLLQFIPTLETATNCTFGGADLRWLYITAGKSLYRIRTLNAGRLAYPTREQAARAGRRAEQALGSAPRVIVPATAAGGYAAFPDLTRAANGDLICVFYSGYAHVSHPKAGWEWGGRLMLTRSRDEGRTWSVPRIIMDTPHDDRDPHVSRLRDGRLMLTWFTTWNPEDRPVGETHPHGLFLSTSADDGGFWSTPQRVRLDSPRWWAASAPVRELKDGALLLGLYTADPATARAWGGVTRSLDGGRSWSVPAAIGEQARLPLDAETDVVALKDGRLLAALRSSKVNLHFAWSRDGGRSWSEPVDAGFKGHCPIFLRLRNGTLLLGHRLPNTALHWSRDDGRTWQGPVEIDSVSGAYPGLAQLDDGDVYVVYYEEGPASAIRGRRLKVTADGIRFVTRAGAPANVAAAPYSGSGTGLRRRAS